MAPIASHMSVAQAATIINAIITFIQITLSLALIIVLIFFLPKTNSAPLWSSISRTLHSSIWPSILRAESSSGEAGASSVVSIVSYLSMMSTILIPLAGIALPLGLHEGPLLHSTSQYIAAKYIRDLSALGSATTPNRDPFHYGRLCGTNDTITFCPGDGDSRSNTSYAPAIVQAFNSTPHGPFSMQYRRFTDGDGPRRNISAGVLGTFQPLISQGGLFAVEGLIVDMSLDHPGVGFWNHTIPMVEDGGSWALDILWMEPVTECIDTNLTIDYVAEFPIQEFYITDHGGFSNLSNDLSMIAPVSQDIDLRLHAYKGAVDSNYFVMRDLNLLGKSLEPGQSYLLDSVALNILLSDGPANNRIANLALNYSISRTAPSISDLETLCQGYEGASTTNMAIVQVTCGILLGPPLRTDGGDPRIFDLGSSWSQTMHACASATRASIQRVMFSTNDTSSLQNLHITRVPSNISVLWGVENTDHKIQDINALWGRVDDQLEGHPSLSTLRRDHLYLPAGSSGLPGSMGKLSPGEPSSAHATAWINVYGTNPNPALADYTGGSDYSIRAKFQNIFEQNQTAAPGQIRNAVWTDIMANTLVGTQTSSILLVARNLRSIDYDFRFAIPGFMLAAIWAPTFIVAAILLTTRMLTLDYMRQVLDHTSVGRVVAGNSVLRVQRQSIEKSDTTSEPVPSLLVDPLNRVWESPKSGGGGEKSYLSAPVVGRALVVLDLNRQKGRPASEEFLVSMP